MDKKRNTYNKGFDEGFDSGYDLGFRHGYDHGLTTQATANNPQNLCTILDYQVPPDTLLGASKYQLIEAINNLIVKFTLPTMTVEQLVAVVADHLKHHKKLLCLDVYNRVNSSDGAKFLSLLDEFDTLIVPSFCHADHMFETLKLLQSFSTQKLTTQNAVAKLFRQGILRRLLRDDDCLQIIDEDAEAIVTFLKSGGIKAEVFDANNRRGLMLLGKTQYNSDVLQTHLDKGMVIIDITSISRKLANGLMPLR